MTAKTTIPLQYPPNAVRPFDTALAARPLLLHGVMGLTGAALMLGLSTGAGFGRAAALALTTALAAGLASHRFEKRRAARGEIQSLRSEALSTAVLPLLGLLALTARLALALAGGGPLPLPVTLLLPLTAATPVLAGLCLGALPTLGRAGLPTWIPALLGSALALLAFVSLCFPLG